MSRFLLVGLFVAMVSGLGTSDARAQRDAGSKMRGDTGTWSNPRTPGRSGGSFYYQPARPSADSYRSFSYEPIGVSAGETVVVSGENVKLMRGTTVVGSAPQGLKFTVTKVINGWLGTVVEVNGQELNGWIWHKNVASEAQAKPAEPQAAAQTDGQSDRYRRFSYEPSSPRYRTSERTKPPWAYLKTDPRRQSP